MGYTHRNIECRAKLKADLKLDPAWRFPSSQHHTAFNAYKNRRRLYATMPLFGGKKGAAILEWQNWIHQGS